MEIKQENKVNFTEYIEEIINIKHELDGEIHTLNFQSNLFGKTIISSIKQEENEDLNIDPIIEINPHKIKYSNRRRTKLRGKLLNGSYIKWNYSSTGIIICEVCGNLYKKKDEYFCHFSTNHSLKQQKMYTSKSKKIGIKNIRRKALGTVYDKVLKQGLLQDTLNLTYQPNVIDNLKSPQGSEVVLSGNICNCSNSGKKPSNCHDQTSKKPFQCGICLKYFSTKCHLNIHICSKTGKFPYKCEICSKSFSTAQQFSVHIHTCEKSYKCGICFRHFSTKANLNVHLRIHTSLKPFKCDICLKNFSQKQHLKTHMILHTDEKPFKCDICLKHFIQKQHLKMHMFRHPGEKPIKCVICLKSFSTAQQFSVHTHTGEKSYKCGFCSRHFLTKDNLNVHLRIHTREKPFK